MPELNFKTLIAKSQTYMGIDDNVGKSLSKMASFDFKSITKKEQAAPWLSKLNELVGYLDKAKSKTNHANFKKWIDDTKKELVPTVTALGRIHSGTWVYNAQTKQWVV
jgi:hypothetical protein